MADVVNTAADTFSRGQNHCGAVAVARCGEPAAGHTGRLASRAAGVPVSGRTSNTSSSCQSPVCCEATRSHATSCLGVQFEQAAQRRVVVAAALLVDRLVPQEAAPVPPEETARSAPVDRGASGRCSTVSNTCTGYLPSKVIHPIVI
jgi:hypothetical protein